jgi:uncharacterized protein YyaL (SSP411 family)
MTTSPSSPRNRLAQETSPYLLQHAANPVDWYPWGDEAFALAAKQGKPVLLSVGYSACHWCHVMAHESFEDPEIGALMNELFVNIKVDREERPDVDKIYQVAQQMLTQRGGGWPLTMFLSPADRKPFFGGTYFPKDARYGMPAFPDLLKRVAEFYASRGEDIAQQGNALSQAFTEMRSPAPSDDLTLNRAPLDKGRELLLRDFDKQYGGFGGAPKFPHPTNLILLLRAWRATAGAETPDLHSLYASTLTLTRMAEGGLYDQLGGGFCRYSTDAYWMIPHFEKMLYDNGPLLGVYAEAAIATGEALFKTTAIETAEWMLRDMRSPEGAFWSTLDADSEGHEGKFYVWTPDEVRKALTTLEYDVFSRRFGLDRTANFEGAWHLHVYRSLEEIENETGAAQTEVVAALASARTKLLKIRKRRIWPGRDEKILTAWNGLAISGLAVAARALARPDLASAATDALDFIRGTLWKDGRLLATYKEGRARFAAYLDDYAFVLDGAIELLQCRWRSVDLAFATQLADVLLAHFEDREDGGFFFTADDAEQLLYRPKSFADEAMPAGNGVAAYALARLGFLLGEARYLKAAERTLRAAWSVLDRYPQAHSALLVALEEYLDAPQIVIVRGDDADTKSWRAELAKLYSPRRLVFAIPSGAKDLPAAIADKQPQATTVAYVCEGMTCSAPVNSLAALVALTRG